MSSYRDCFRSRHGEQGRHRWPKTWYYKDGHQINSQTGERLSETRCADADRCSKLKHSGRKPLWEPSSLGNMI